MQTATISFDRFNKLADTDAGERIRAGAAAARNRAAKPNTVSMRWSKSTTKPK